MSMRNADAFAPSPLEGEGRGGGWLGASLMDPHPRSLPSRGSEAMNPTPQFKTVQSHD